MPPIERGWAGVGGPAGSYPASSASSVSAASGTTAIENSVNGPSPVLVSDPVGPVGLGRMPTERPLSPIMWVLSS
jgi:hypothetical protein